MQRRGRSHGRPRYRQVADDIRAAIEDGTLRPGQLLPPEKVLAERYDVSLVAVRAGLSVLRGEGLIETRRGKGSRVRARPEMVVVSVPPERRITARMPTEQEREELGIPEGTPVIIVTDPDGTERMYAADRTELRTTDADDAGSDT